MDIEIRVKKASCRRDCWRWVVLVDGRPTETGQEATEALARDAARKEADSIRSAGRPKVREAPKRVRPRGRHPEREPVINTPQQIREKFAAWAAQRKATVGEPMALVSPPPDLSVGPVRPTRPAVVTTVVVGPPGQAMAEISAPLMERYADRIGADFHVIRRPATAYPLGEKFRVGTLFDHWERVLYLDADVVLDPSCPDLFAEVPVGKVGIHDDLPIVLRRSGPEWLAKQYKDLARSQGWAIPEGYLACHNTGVIVAGREHRELFAPPERPYPMYHCGEQNVINWRLRDMPVHLLPAEFNYQWWADREMRGPAWVWHYARPRGMADAVRLAAMRAKASG